MRDRREMWATVVIVERDGTEVVIARVDARAPDLALADALARLQLAARRHGLAMRLRDLPEDLRALLELLGLAEALALEPRGQPEVGEELGVEEVVQPGDPPG